MPVTIIGNPMGGGGDGSLDEFVDAPPVIFMTPPDRLLEDPDLPAEDISADDTHDDFSDNTPNVVIV
jgi:hypothetical protein